MARAVSTPIIIGLVTIAAIVGIFLVATAVLALMILGLVLLVIGVGGLGYMARAVIGRIPNPRLRHVTWGLLGLFIAFYLMAVFNPTGGGDASKSLYTNISAGCFTGLVVLLAQEYVRHGGLPQ